MGTAMSINLFPQISSSHKLHKIAKTVKHNQELKRHRKISFINFTKLQKHNQALMPLSKSCDFIEATFKCLTKSQIHHLYVLKTSL